MVPMRLTRSLLGDVALAVVLAVIGVVGTIGADDLTSVDLSIDARGLSLVLGCAAVLVFRRRWPLGTLAIATILSTTYLILGYSYGPILLSFAITVYTAARQLPPRTSGPASAAALVLLLLHLFTNEAALPGYLGLLPGAAWVIVPFTIGFAVRTTQQSVAQSRAELVRQRVDDERLRVAQEVHDVVGHGLVAIKMQADLALHLLQKKPEHAEVALTAISRTSTDALDELRATLAVVRSTEPDAPRAPAPGVSRLPELIQRIRDSGVAAELAITGEPRELSPAVELAGYRVVQESLTNALRHSDARIATVLLDYRDHVLVITVSNPAQGVRPSSEGTGIAGMRQRVTLLGGEFAAGPTPEGAFEVCARLPTAERP